jgi:hypothetical protein
VRIGSLLRSNGWRVVPIAVALVVGAAPWDAYATVGGVFAATPVVLWCWLLARTRRTGLIVAALLIVLQAWIVVPRAVGWTGQWLVPSFGDMVTWYPWLAAGICVVGVSVERRRAGQKPLSLGWLVAGASAATMVLCCSGALWYLAGLSDAPPGDEGLLPMPAGLTVSARDPLCGSGGCAQSIVVSGDQADARVRAHLAERGYGLRADPQWQTEFAATARHRTGVLCPHHVWLGYRASGTGSVTIIWSVERRFLS